MLLVGSSGQHLLLLYKDRNLLALALSLKLIKAQLSVRLFSSNTYAVSFSLFEIDRATVSLQILG